MAASVVFKLQVAMTLIPLRPAGATAVRGSAGNVCWAETAVAQNNVTALGNAATILAWQVLG